MAPIEKTPPPRRGREEAIETLLDLDPHGSAYRVAKTKSSAIVAALQGRPNRITDGALFDAAHALGDYEVALDSPEILDLYSGSNNIEKCQKSDDEGAGEKDDDDKEDRDAKNQESAASDDKGGKDGVNDDNNMEGKAEILKEGWQTRILRHHDKIIRAKNHANSNPTISSLAPSTTTPGIQTKPASSATIESSAIPPPALISALRQIFGTVSSPDLQDLLNSTGGEIADNSNINNNDGKGDKEESVNTLPSLLHAVVDHNVFKGNSSVLPAPIDNDIDDTDDSLGQRGKKANVKRAWKSLFELTNDGETNQSGGEKGKEDDDTSINRDESDRPDIASGGINVEKGEVRRVPAAANLESILGNACRDILQENGTQNSRVHGLLIAALSVMTGCVCSQEDLEKLNHLGELSKDGSSMLSSPPTTSAPAGTEGTLQVGALLSILPKDDDDTPTDFALNDELLEYFVNASATYEERIEIQKANLFKSQTPISTTPLLTDSTTPLPRHGSGDGSEVVEAKKSDSDYSASAVDENVSSESTMPSLINRPSESSESNNEGEDLSANEEAEFNRLFQNIVDIVSDHIDDDENTSSNENDDRHLMEDQSESEHEIIDSDEDYEDGEEHDSESEGTDDEDLARALALSLAAAIGADDSSDSSQSEDSSSHQSDEGSSGEGGSNTPEDAAAASVKAAATKTPAAKNEMSNAADPKEQEDNSTPLPRLPIPPSISLLPNYYTDLEIEEKDSDEGNLLSTDLSVVFEPSALSTFGQLPASNVLLHLLSAVLRLMQGHKSTDDNSSDAISASTGENTFSPDSTTVSLLIASIQILSHLRSSAMAMLRDLLADAAMEESFPPKDDPAGVEFAVVSGVPDSLESKGLNRKAAAAAEGGKATLKLVELWKKKIAFYSATCYLNLRCLRIMIGRYTQQRDIAELSVDQDAVERQPISISTKTRLALLSVLSYFHSSETSKTFQSFTVKIETLYTKCNCIICTEELQQGFFIVSLCNESLYLWASALSLLYSDHASRVELLGGMLASVPSSSTVGSKIDKWPWTEDDLQSFKLDVLCKRLRVCDMLDHFVAPPMINIAEADNQEGDEKNHTHHLNVPETSLSVISLLTTFIKTSPSKGDSNLTKFYLALCQRAMSNLLLWNDLSASSNDESSGSAWEDGSLQLKVNPSKFHFDSSKCADSISVASPSSSPAITANQRATKVWGTVLSTSCFLPKSGVHRWAVKLDKCERGHVFLGVSTARANLKTYVGGDSNGWGLIGTQALWHDRNKLRGDYGATFRTGAIVVITLDTNVGTLSFGLWKDGSSSAPEVGGPLSPQALMASPRRGSTGGSPTISIEDWGIAFEGLPLDVKLYPAVGLYQRDDHVTLYTVSSRTAQSTSLLSPISSGDIYFPSLTKEEEKEEESHHRRTLVRSWNQGLCSDGVAFAIDILSRLIELLSSGDVLSSDENNILLTKILPSLASSICLIPSCIPTLSSKYAMELLPLVTRCAKLIDKILPSKDKSNLVELKEGNWTISVDSSGDSQDVTDSFEEYVVCFKRSEIDETASANHTSYLGTSANNDCSIIGSSCGTHIHFVEEWCSKSLEVEEVSLSSFNEYEKSSKASYVIDARINLDGMKFTGDRHSTDGSTERVIGRLKSSATEGQSKGEDFTKQLIQTEYLLCLAAGHLSSILCSQTPLSDIDKTKESSVVEEPLESLLSTSSILSRGTLDRDGSTVRCAIDSIWDRCRCASETHSNLVEQWQDSIYFELFATTDASKEDLTKIDKAKRLIEQQSRKFLANQKASLSRLCPDKYERAQKAIASAIYYHIIGLTNGSPSEDVALHTALQESLRIMENGIRNALVSSAQANLSHKEICTYRCMLFGLIAEYIFEFSPNVKQSIKVIVDDIALIFKSIKSEQELDYIKRCLHARTEKSIMRFVSLRSLHLLLQPEKVNVKSDYTLEGIRLDVAVEAVLVSLPRLLCPPMKGTAETHLVTMTAGSAASVQTCVLYALFAIYDEIGTIFAAAATDQGSTSLILGLLANYVTVIHPTAHSDIIFKMLPSLRVIVAQVRDHALRTTTHGEDMISPPPETRLPDIVRQQENQVLLSTVASILLTSCAQLSEGPCDSTRSIDLLLELLLQEFTETLTVVKEETTVSTNIALANALQSDWTTYKGSATGIKKDEPTSLKYIAANNWFLPLGDQSVDSPSIAYLSQLLNVLLIASNPQSLLKFIKVRASTFLTVFGFKRGDYSDLTENTKKEGSPLRNLPLKLRRRILRVLRPILLSIDADGPITSLLLDMAGSVASISEIHSQDELMISQSALSLLRYLYTYSPSWRGAINETITTCKSNESPVFRGILTFLGGVIGCLQPGSFVMIKPESSSSSGSTKPRSGGGSTTGAGVAPNTAATSFGSGAEGVVAGLCRHNALSGVMSSVHNGMCEVIVLANKTHAHPPTQGTSTLKGDSKVTIRAVRVSASSVCAADELPLVLDDANLPDKNVFNQMSKTIQSVSYLIKSISNKELSELDIDPTELIESSLSLRSATVLTSKPKLIHKYLDDESSGLQLLLAHALQIGSLRNKNIQGLSSLSSLEARIWHLLLVRLAVKARKIKLENTPPSSLRALFEEDKPRSSSVEDAPSASKSPPKKSIRTPPSVASSFFFGGERPPRNLSSRSAASRRDDDANASTENDESEVGDEDVDASDTASHLREAAIVQMAELGLPRQWAELALRSVGGTNIEAAVHFCLERGGDMERLLAEDSERSNNRGSSSSSFLSSRRRGFSGTSRVSSSANLIRQLTEMGFPRHWCVEALTATGNNVDDALTWILVNGDRLSAEDEAAEEDIDDDESQEDDEEDTRMLDNNDDEEEEDSKEEESIAPKETDQNVESQALKDEIKEPTHHTWAGVCPVRFVSGKSNINPNTLDITGLPSGGFSSVGTKGVLLTRGKWYYEAEIKTAGCLQIGWADSSFAGHCQADRGDGVGDGPSSWAFDGWRRYRWHSRATEWGAKWSEGDVVGCLVDMDTKSVSFTLNGKGEEIGMGVAYSGEGFRPCSGVYACVSFNRKERLRLILGGKGTEPFNYSPPEGYRGIGEAIQDAVKERDILLAEEKILIEPTDITSNDKSSESVDSKRYLCDHSDNEHGHELFAWQHRYYGSDASVHLGPGRPSTSLFTGKSAGSTQQNKDRTAADISSRLGKILATNKLKTTDEDTSTNSDAINILKKAYSAITLEVDNELTETCASICVLYSQKLVIHTMISQSSQFSLRSFLPTSSPVMSEQDVSRRLWQIIERCTSLQSSGWVGEAGAMALAAEALGLGISAGDNKSKSIPTGMCTVSATNNQVLLPCGGVSQFLMSAISSQGLTHGFSAASEIAIGSETGGLLVFLRASLQSAIVSSSSFREILLAAIRRSLRQLANSEYVSDETTPEDDESLVERKRSQSNSDKNSIAPDARLVSFLSGALISVPVCEQLSDSENIAVRCSLFEAWSIGLLSASAPWRMVCALTSAGILNICPEALAYATSRIPTIANYIGRLQSTVLRRTWAERASVPVCSKYAQALIELLTSVKHAIRICPDATCLPNCISSMTIQVDSATPLPFSPSCNHNQTSDNSGTISECKSWECSEGWVLSNTGWEIWTGTVEIMAVEWKTPARSGVRTLMDSGEGPPLLREGCTVLRGVDWDATKNDDGKDVYEKDKLEKEEKIREEEEDEERLDAAKKEKEAEKDESPVKESSADNPTMVANRELDPADDDIPVVTTMPTKKAEEKVKKDDKPKKKKKPIASKLPLGTVLSVEPWDDVPAMARKVRWHLTGEEGIYRYGGDGGRFDLLHVETNEKETRAKKKHPVPESLEQCASRYGFGKQKVSNIILRLLNCPVRNGHIGDTDDANCDGILEWPDFGAGIRVACDFHSDGAISITEKEILYGTKDSGWETRFGCPNYIPGTVMIISPTQTTSSGDSSLSAFEEFLGSNSFLVKNLRNKETCGRLRVTSEMRLQRSKQSATSPEPSMSFSSSQPPPICFDPNFHAPSISLSKDKRSVTCISSDGRGVAFGNVGFSKGVHYWEVKLEKAEIGSVYIGVAEKPSAGSSSTSSGFDGQSRLNRWLGWGFVNFRATYTTGAERVYGAHIHNGDTVGVLLDCDAGRVSYFLDGLKYGEHIINDLGCAFENMSPFGFNADGCGSGGIGQGAPSAVDGGRTGRYPANGAIRPNALWPVIGLRHPGDRVTMSSKWLSNQGVNPADYLTNICNIDEVMCTYDKPQPQLSITQNKITNELPQWFVEESFHEYTRWKSGTWLRTETRGSGPCKLSSYGLDIDLDTSQLACATACASIGLPIALLSGDHIDVKRSAGRILELQEEAVILGTYQNRLFYRLVSQKSEGGSLMEGGGRAWFWDESDAVDGGLQLIGEGLGHSVPLPKLERFSPRCGGLKVVYLGGAVVRSDLEIFDGSMNIGTIAMGTIIPQHDVIERRHNSCGVARYLINHEPIGRGWISSHIRGGKEDPIVEMLPYTDECSGDILPQYLTPEDSAREWYENYMQVAEVATERDVFLESMNIESAQEFGQLLKSGMISGMEKLSSDALLAETYGRITDALPHTSQGGCPFADCALVLSASQPNYQQEQACVSRIEPVVFEVATESLLHVVDKLPSTKALMTRIAMLRALNRRARFGLPFLPMKSAQEGSAIFGGLCGFGASLQHAGNTWDEKANKQWVQVPSISSRLRHCRGIIFTSTKKFFLDSVLDATATPTPLSHDEYELPREVRTVRVNRLKARRAIASDDSGIKKKHSVFSQLQREMRGWSGSALRRGFVAKGHGGQKRSFKVKLVGEGVNDYSGPYREVFTDAFQEITDLDSSKCSSLGILDPTANNKADVGEGRDLFVFASSPNDLNVHEKNSDLLSIEEKDLLNSFSSLTHRKNESSREVEEALSYLGKLVGTATRHGIPCDLPLPLGIVWKRLTEENVGVDNAIKEIDLLAFKTGDNTDMLVAAQRRLLNSFAEGMASVLPVELLSMFTGEQLRDIVCGNGDIDVELLRRVVEYEGYSEHLPKEITFFWEVLREMTTTERKLFLQFVWARNRLPLKESDFDAPFKIQRDTKSVNEVGDYPLPCASTCFFSLSLPEYPTKEILKQKLLFAIENSTTMESDYQTNDVEINEGWRGL